MKNLYETPELEILRFTFADILANEKLNPSADEDHRDDGGDVGEGGDPSDW